MKKGYLNYYLLLEVAPTATTEDIKAAYKLAALKYHPDKQGGTESATKLFQMLNDAKECLLNPEERRKYDKSIGIASDMEHAPTHIQNPSEWKKLAVVAVLCLLVGIVFGASTK